MSTLILGGLHDMELSRLTYEIVKDNPWAETALTTHGRPVNLVTELNTDLSETIDLLVRVYGALYGPTMDAEEMRRAAGDVVPETNYMRGYEALAASMEDEQ